MEDQSLSGVIEIVLKELSKLRRYDLSSQVDEELIDVKRDVLGRRVLDLYHKYDAQLEGTPEGRYLLSILNLYNQESKMSELYNRPIEELNLSTRLYNVLRCASIKSIGQLVKIGEEDIIKYRNIGRVTAAELKTKLKEVGLELGMKIQ